MVTYIGSAFVNDKMHLTYPYRNVAPARRPKSSTSYIDAFSALEYSVHSIDLDSCYLWPISRIAIFIVSYPAAI